MDLLKPPVPTPLDVVSADEARSVISDMQRRLGELEREKAAAEHAAASAERRAGAEPVDPGMRAWEEHQLERFRAHLRAEHEVEMQALLDAAQRRAAACVEQAQRDADLIVSYTEAIGEVRGRDEPTAAHRPVAPPAAPAADVATGDPTSLGMPAIVDAPAPPVDAQPAPFAPAPPPVVASLTVPKVDVPVDSRGVPVPPAPPLDDGGASRDAAPATGGDSPTASGVQAGAAAPTVLAPTPVPTETAGDELPDPVVDGGPAPTVVPPPPPTAPPPTAPPPPSMAPVAPAEMTREETGPIPVADDGGQGPPTGDNGSDGPSPGGSGDDSFWPEKQRRSGLRGLLGRIHALAVLQVVAVVIILVVVLLRIR
jgi:hypothetical protein